MINSTNFFQTKLRILIFVIQTIDLKFLTTEPMICFYTVMILKM